VCTEYGGVFPADPALLADLPGIGRSTAAAISAFSYGTRAAILDGNVKRVFCRVYGIDAYPGTRPVEELLWRRAEALLPSEGVEAYTQGLMDLGATLCTRSKPSCTVCPLARHCAAYATDRVAQLPVRKPRKAIPEKRAGMLVVMDRGQVLLQQRPDMGIWGGLLSLPEFEVAADDAPDAGPGTLGARIAPHIAPFGTIASYEKLQPFSHGFTHFKLHVLPYRIALARRLHPAGQLDHVWYDIGKLAQAPLPAPVKKLLLALTSEQDLFFQDSVR
jgi:A/G-specific adenine glycosylase